MNEYIIDFANGYRFRFNAISDIAAKRKASKQATYEGASFALSKCMSCAEHTIPVGRRDFYEYRDTSGRKRFGWRKWDNRD